MESHPDAFVFNNSVSNRNKSISFDMDQNSPATESLVIKNATTKNLELLQNINSFTELKNLEIQGVNVCGHLDMNSFPEICTASFINCDLKKLKDICPRNAEYNISTLQYLNLSGNKIRILSSSRIYLFNLTNLDLSFNLLSEVNVENFMSLTRIDLSSNQLTSLKTIRGCFNLKTLIVSNNVLSSLEGISSFQNLEVLNVADNFIKVYSSFGELEVLSKLEKLILRGNPLTLSETYRINVCRYLSPFVVPNSFTIDQVHLSLPEVQVLGIMPTYIALRSAGNSLNSVTSSQNTIIPCSSQNSLTNTESFYELVDADQNSQTSEHSSATVVEQSHSQASTDTSSYIPTVLREESECPEVDDYVISSEKSSSSESNKPLVGQNLETLQMGSIDTFASCLSHTPPSSPNPNLQDEEFNDSILLSDSSLIDKDEQSSIFTVKISKDDSFEQQETQLSFSTTQMNSFLGLYSSMNFSIPFLNIHQVIHVEFLDKIQIHCVSGKSSTLTSYVIHSLECEEIMALLEKRLNQKIFIQKCSICCTNAEVIKCGTIPDSDREISLCCKKSQFDLEKNRRSKSINSSERSIRLSESSNDAGVQLKIIPESVNLAESSKFENFLEMASFETISSEESSLNTDLATDTNISMSSNHLETLMDFRDPTWIHGNLKLFLHGCIKNIDPELIGCLKCWFIDPTDKSVNQDVSNYKHSLIIIASSHIYILDIIDPILGIISSDSLKMISQIKVSTIDHVVLTMGGQCLLLHTVKNSNYKFIVANNQYLENFAQILLDQINLCQTKKRCELTRIKTSSALNIKNLVSDFFATSDLSSFQVDNIELKSEFIDSPLFYCIGWFSCFRKSSDLHLAKESNSESNQILFDLNMMTLILSRTCFILCKENHWESNDSSVKVSPFSPLFPFYQRSLSSLISIKIFKGMKNLITLTFRTSGNRNVEDASFTFGSQLSLRELIDNEDVKHLASVSTEEEDIWTLVFTSSDVVELIISTLKVVWEEWMLKSVRVETIELSEQLQKTFQLSVKKTMWG